MRAQMRTYLSRLGRPLACKLSFRRGRPLEAIWKRSSPRDPSLATATFNQTEAQGRPRMSTF